MRHYDHHTDADIHSFVTEIRGISITRDIWRHRWLIFRVWLGISRHATKKDLPWIREWITRLQGVKHYKPSEYSITAHTQNTSICSN